MLLKQCKTLIKLLVLSQNTSINKGQLPFNCLSTLTSQRGTMGKLSLSPLDPSSFARPELAVITNILLSLNINFATKTFKGNVDLNVKKVVSDIDEIILDVKDLNIISVSDVRTNESLLYTISESLSEFGSSLAVKLPKGPTNGGLIRIEYETKPNASGLQWLTSEQTAGKEHPFVFSQFQATHARSVIPCQDTPSVKVPYKAVISAPSDLTVLMSAIREKTTVEEGIKFHHFRQDVPVPSYLIAVAVGALESRKLGPRSHVWAEKELISKAEYEFAGTENQLLTAEAICGPYIWGIYDLLVLPPSFPFGGMENPCLTFVTPTLLAGDRSLANVVAHEIAHSWTGNLVTNRNFEHFWLNEGFTVFVERKILGRLESPEEQDFQALGGASELNETINELGKDNPLTSLVVNLKGVHTDDAFSRVPYEKGYIFLRYLEEIVGGPERFEPFLRKYFETYKYKSIDTDDFQQFFKSYFANEAIEQIDWHTWLYSPGMPAFVPSYNKDLYNSCAEFKQSWLLWDVDSDPDKFTSDEIKYLTTSQVIHFLQELLDEPKQSIEKLKCTEKLFGFGETENSEIKFRWLRISLKGRWEEKIQATLDWVNVVGRMKYVRPLYKDLYNWELARPKAIANFKEHSKFMMHVTAYTLTKDLHL